MEVRTGSFPVWYETPKVWIQAGTSQSYPSLYSVRMNPRRMKPSKGDCFRFRKSGGLITSKALFWDLWWTLGG